MVLKRLKEEQAILRKEIKEKTIGYILAALGLVAGLAWNETIKAFIDQFFPRTGSDLIAKLIYAVLVTIIIVIVSVYVVRTTQKKDV